MPFSKSAVALAIVAAALLPAPSPAALQPHAAPPSVSAETLVRAAVDAPRHVSFVGQLSAIRSGAKRAYAVVIRVEHLAPDRTRRTYLAPQALYGQFVITRGAMSWDVDNARKRVVVTENRAADDQVITRDDISLLSANYRAVRAGDDDVANRKADTIDLVNRYTGERTMRLWLDSGTHVVLAKEEYHTDGSLAWRTRYDAIRYTSDIPTQIFSADTRNGFSTVAGRSYGHPSDDLTRAIAECDFNPIGPKDLPEGFAVVTADLTRVAGSKNLHLVYSDGLRNVSLFENGGDRAVDFGAAKPQTTSFENHPAEYVRDGPTTLLSWREHGVAFALVGDLDLKELTKIAMSVVP